VPEHRGYASESTGSHTVHGHSVHVPAPLKLLATTAQSFSFGPPELHTTSAITQRWLRRLAKDVPGVALGVALDIARIERASAEKLRNGRDGGMRLGLGAVAVALVDDELAAVDHLGRDLALRVWLAALHDEALGRPCQQSVIHDDEVLVTLGRGSCCNGQSSEDDSQEASEDSGGAHDA
jgi:hypothetical protein